MSDTWESCRLSATYLINRPLTQAVSQDVATWCCSHKLSSNCNICRYTQPPVQRTRTAPGSHNHIKHSNPSDMSLVS
ncbi:hypothetical protein F383_21761 [Gossypium arboreum]|uniref:Uncharacterized protein n=1 Tax=Gossypium arboreum TaxID=29729 RepID=A0A0B0NW91_GOSAR|nr:hypothetical protein F383_21761 [Gossypium arboreum]